MAEKIYIDRDMANDFVFGYDGEDYKTVYEKQVDSGRWYSYHLLVIKRKSDGKFFGAQYTLGLTECQERSPFEEEDTDSEGNVEFKEFKEIEIVKKEYVPVDES